MGYQENSGWAVVAGLKRLFDRILSVGEYTGESESQRARRRIIGINSGPVVARVIGRHKFAYDLWGDVVNTASRMEAEGVPGSIQVSAATHELIDDKFVCEPRGLISVKGKGEMETYVLVSRRPGS